MFGRFRIRTDLALEARESFEEDDVKIRGVRIEEEDDEELPSLGFSTIIFGGNSKFISSQTSIFAGFFHIQKNLTKKFLPLYIYSAIVL